MLVEAWSWTPRDHILSVLPLHHVHGIVNVLLCALWSGARISFLPEMQTKFSAGLVWDAFKDLDLSLFMAVPTVYAKLIEEFHKTSEDPSAQV